MGIARFDMNSESSINPESWTQFSGFYYGFESSFKSLDELK